jgi:excisionase family DNA binding protein
VSVDLSTWIPKAEAAGRLGISERTLDRRCDAGTGPERRERPRPGLKPEPVYNPDDVERLAVPKTHVMPNGLPVASGEAIQLASYAAEQICLRQLADVWLMEAKSVPPVPPLLPPALYLTLPQASAYTGLTVTLLRRLIQAGKLTAIRDRTMKVKRTDLDNITSLSELSKRV